jgi:aspartate aminotransferase-like enzyme
MLQNIYQSSAEVIPMTCSGRGAVEGAFASTLEPGEKIVVVANGVFCNMMVAIAERLQLEPVVVRSEPGKPVDLNKIEDAAKTAGVKAIAAVHSETSTGALNPAKEIGDIAKKHDLYYVLDCISSLGGVDIRPDEWGVDFCITGSQKCLASLSGLSLLTVSDRMWDVFKARKTPIQSFYFDIQRWRLMWIPPERGGELIFQYRRMPQTAATHLFYALHESCKMILEEGLEARFARHEKVARGVRAGLKAMGLAMFPDPGLESPTLSAFLPPDGIPDGDIRKTMKKEFGISLAGGLEEFHGKMIRFGHMGNTASPEYVVPTLSALELTLQNKGVSVTPGAGTSAFYKSYASNP